MNTIQTVSISQLGCIINVEQSPFNLLDNDYDNFELRDKIFERTSAWALSLYPQTMIVNKTNTNIQVKTQIEKGGKVGTIEVGGGANEFFFSYVNKAQLKIQGFNWSKQFDTSTVGLTGSIEIKKEE